MEEGSSALEENEEEDLVQRFAQQASLAGPPLAWDESASSTPQSRLDALSPPSFRARAAVASSPEVPLRSLVREQRGLSTDSAHRPPLRRESSESVSSGASVTPRIGGVGGRVVGPSRSGSFPGREEDPQIARTYRTLVGELLSSPPVPLSGQAPEDDAGSEPDEDDGIFLESVLTLEVYRPRPASRGSSGRLGSLESVPTSSASMELGDIPSRPWDMIPRGTVSEWFPTPFAATTGVWGCEACRVDVDVFVAQLQRRSESCRAFAERGDRGYESALGVLPTLDWSENRLRSVYTIANHSCACGRPLSLPVVLFTPQGRPIPIAQPRRQGVQLRLHLHLWLPGSPMSWVAQGPFSAVFPLFGLLRRYWGRFVQVRGSLSLAGHPPRAGRQPVVTHTLTVLTRSRHRGVLRHAPLEVVTTTCYSCRGDIFIYGASLQWEGMSPQESDLDLRLPTEVTLDQLRRAFHAPPLIHSYRSRGEDGEEALQLPTRPYGSFPPPPRPSVSFAEDLVSSSSSTTTTTTTVAPSRRRRRRVLSSGEDTEGEGPPLRRSRRFS